MPVIPQPPLSSSGTTINLDISAVAGFFGGDSAVAAMGTASLRPGRRWFGWFNSPGSYKIAKRYGRLAPFGIWRGLFPGVKEAPAVLFGLDGQVGPKFFGIQSNTIMAKTGHLAYLFQRECQDSARAFTWRYDRNVDRETVPTDVTVASLDHNPNSVVLSQETTVSRWSNLVALFPILASATTAVLCIWYRDYKCFSAIIVGMFSSGLACAIIGSGKFKFMHPPPTPGVACGLLEDGDQIVVLQGMKSAINAITRGSFSLQFKSHPNYRDIGVASLVLTIQFLAQLLLVPLGTTFGQIMFLTSLGVSWIHNSSIASIDNESIQRLILHGDILQKPPLQKYKFGTRTSAAVFVLLVLAHSDRSMTRELLEQVLNTLIPNVTEVWSAWKTRLLDEIEAKRELAAFQDNPSVISSVKSAGGQQLLQYLFKDAQTACKAFGSYRPNTGTTTVDDESRTGQSSHKPGEPGQVPELGSPGNDIEMAEVERDGHTSVNDERTSTDATTADLVTSESPTVGAHLEKTQKNTAPSFASNVSGPDTRSQYEEPEGETRIENSVGPSYPTTPPENQSCSEHSEDAETRTDPRIVVPKHGEHTRDGGHPCE